MNTSKRQSPLSIAFSLALLSIFWFSFAPTQLGGWTTFVIVDGNSMEPRFRFGDLVLVRSQRSYQVGDAVTYQNAEMGRYVFHRIVGLRDGRFILQGDHNTWLDSYQPVQNEIIGKLWIHIPTAGKAIQWAREPLHLAIGCGLIGGIMTASLILSPSRSRREKPFNQPAWSWGGLAEAGLYLTGFAVLSFLGLAVFAFTRPAETTAEPLNYQQDVQFSYSAAGTPGVYDTGMIQTGEPIFPKLTCFLNVGIVYNIAGNGLQTVTGNHQLYMKILDEKSGWQRNIPLTGETSFSGGSFTSSADLNLCEIESLAASMETQTGLHPSIYTLEVVAPTVVMGNLNGQALYDSFEPRLVFKFDEVHFHLETDATQPDPLHVMKTGSIIGPNALPATLNLMGWEIEVRSLRLFSLLGLVFSFAALAAAGWYFFQSAQFSPASMIQMKHRGLLMNVRRINIRKNLPIVDVASIDDLARLAERQNVLIAHAVLNFLHCYTVQTDGTMYRYVVNDPNSAPELEQTLPRLTLPRSPEADYLEATPVDERHDRYLVASEDSRMIKKVRL